MAHIQVVKTIRGTPEEVFAMCSDLEGIVEKIESLVCIEILTPGPIALGTRWRETRRFMGQEATEEMEITRFDPPRSYEVTCEAHGARFVSVFALEKKGGDTEITIDFEAKALTFGARIMVPLMMGSLRKCVENDFEQLAEWADARATAG